MHQDAPGLYALPAQPALEALNPLRAVLRARSSETPAPARRAAPFIAATTARTAAGCACSATRFGRERRSLASSLPAERCTGQNVLIDSLNPAGQRLAPTGAVPAAALGAADLLDRRSARFVRAGLPVTAEDITPRAGLLQRRLPARPRCWPKRAPSTPLAFASGRLERHTCPAHLIDARRPRRRCRRDKLIAHLPSSSACATLDRANSASWPSTAPKGRPCVQRGSGHALRAARRRRVEFATGLNSGARFSGGTGFQVKALASVLSPGATAMEIFDYDNILLLRGAPRQKYRKVDASVEFGGRRPRRWCRPT